LNLKHDDAGEEDLRQGWSHLHDLRIQGQDEEQIQGIARSPCQTAFSGKESASFLPLHFLLLF
jgi:hypothetical protein